MLFLRSIFRSGFLFFHRRGEGRGVFLPIMHQQQGPNWHRGMVCLSWDKDPVSRLTPSQVNLPRRALHHSHVLPCPDPEAQASVLSTLLPSNHETPPPLCKHKHETPPPLCKHKHETPPPVCKIPCIYIQTSTHALPTVLVEVKLYMLAVPWRWQSRSACPQERLRKQLPADEKFMVFYHVLE